LSKAFPASVARFFMLQAHYRSISWFSDDAIVAAEKDTKTNGGSSHLKTARSKYRQHIDIATWKQSCMTPWTMIISYFNRTIIWRSSFYQLLHDGKETLNALT
jgi:cysteinyl-tRNA synthetase